MRLYDWKCETCGAQIEEDRYPDGVVPLCPVDSQPMVRRSHFQSLSIGIPLNFHTVTEEVLGTKDKIRKMQEKGEIVSAAKGSRWV